MKGKRHLQHDARALQDDEEPFRRAAFVHDHLVGQRDHRLHLLDHQADDPRVGAPEERHFREEPPVHLQRELDAQRIRHLSNQLALLEQRQPERRPSVLVILKYAALQPPPDLVLLQ